MLLRVLVNLIAVLAALLLLVDSAGAQQTVYKWVDEDGVVHFSDAPPAEPGGSKVDTLALSAPPAAAKPEIRTAAVPPASVPAKSRSSLASAPARTVIFDASKLTLGELDERCDAARERKIAPLRAAEIAKCKDDKRNDPAWCERFNADYGDASRTASGTMRPRQFDDLPECVEALQERNRRGR